MNQSHLFLGLLVINGFHPFVVDCPNASLALLALA